MARKLEKLELKRIENVERQWLGKKRSLRERLVSKTLKTISPGDIEAFHQKHIDELTRSIERYLLTAGKNKADLEARFYEEIDQKEMNDLRNTAYSELERRAKKGLIKKSLKASLQTFGSGLHFDHKKSVPCDLEYLYPVVEAVGRAYGVQYFMYEERVFAVKIIALALIKDVDARATLLAEIRQMGHHIKIGKSTGLYLSQEYQYDRLARQFGKLIGDALLSMMIFRYVPLLGIYDRTVSPIRLVRRTSNLAISIYKRRLIEIRK